MQPNTKHHKDDEEKSSRADTAQRASDGGNEARKGPGNMVLESRGRPRTHRSRRGRPSQRRSVMALPKAVSARRRANQGGTTAHVRSSLKHLLQGLFCFFLSFQHGKELRYRERIHHSDPESHQDLRPGRGRRPRSGGHRPGYPPGGDLRHHRPLRRRQEHPGPVHEPAGAAHQRHRHRGREGHDGPVGGRAAPGAGPSP